MNTGFTFADLFNFEKLVAPKVLKIVYFLGLLGIALFVLISLAGALSMLGYNFATGLGMVLLTLVGGAFAALFWRIMIEIYMVFFGIYDRLGEIRDALKKD